MAKMTPEELAELLSKLTSDQLDKAGLQKKIEARIDINKASIQDLKALNDEKLRQAQIEIDLANAVQDGTQRIIAEKKARAAQIEALIQYRKKLEGMPAFTEEDIKKKQELEEVIKSLNTTLGTHTKDIGDLQKDLDELNESTKESKKTANEYETSIDSLGKKMVIFGKGPLVKNILGIRKLGTQLANSKEAQENFRQAILDTVNVTNVAGNLLNVVADSTFTLVMALDAASTAFASATGFGNQFNQTMRDAQQQGNYLGVTMDGAGKATQSLVAGFTNFVNISSESQAALVSNVAQLGRIGVSADTSAGLINFFNQNLGMIDLTN